MKIFIHTNRGGSRMVAPGEGGSGGCTSNPLHRTVHDTGSDSASHDSIHTTEAAAQGCGKNEKSEAPPDAIPDSEGE